MSTHSICFLWRNKKNIYLITLVPGAVSYQKKKKKNQVLRSCKIDFPGQLQNNPRKCVYIEQSFFYYYMYYLLILCMLKMNSADDKCKTFFSSSVFLFCFLFVFFFKKKKKMAEKMINSDFSGK